MSECRKCRWVLKGKEVGCLQYGQHGRAAEVEQMKNVLAGQACVEFKESYAYGNG